jgi:hypothetical protein
MTRSGHRFKGNHIRIIGYTTQSYNVHVIKLVSQDFINEDQIQESKEMGWWIYRNTCTKIRID